MSTWVIKDIAGNITNPNITGDEEWVKANYPHYEAYVPDTSLDYVATEEEIATGWRNDELIRTDSMMGATDHPDYDTLAAYRVALREWPSTEDFPATKPAW
tara:strand:+ start:229 stop:531 length:303 start_codon:yes stop_codon:yes gene_type:complete